VSAKLHPLRPENERPGFSCGDQSLDRYLREFAWQNMSRHHVGTTYVAEEAGVVLGYVTLAAGSLSRDGMPGSVARRLPAYPLPILRVARLAVDGRFRGNGIGSELLGVAFDLALDMSERVGCVGLVADARPGVERFYGRFGFETFEALAGHSGVRPKQALMFLPLETVRQALG
jgi:GNAT superfamily N-acetyltransferase